LFKHIHQDAIGDEFTDPSSSAPNKFRNPDELTDSDEEEMAQSDDEEVAHHLNKRMRLNEEDSKLANAPPKWSNPDPYTSLPPIDSLAKRTDVVKLIRKARIESGSGLANSRRPADFISFEADEENSRDEASDPTVTESSRSPTPPPPPPLRSPRGVPGHTLLDDSPTKITGKRKRELDVEDEPRHSRSQEAAYADDRVEAKWRANPGSSATPWLVAHPASNMAGVA
jgi:non-canonical poly(A) RNA polymerase PAPD5/7